MSSENPQDLLKLAVEVATEAAQLIVERRRGTITVADTKSTSTDIVTAVDRESEELIRARVLAGPAGRLVPRRGGRRRAPARAASAGWWTRSTAP